MEMYKKIEYHLINQMASSIKQYLHCPFESVTTANSIVIHFQMDYMY